MTKAEQLKQSLNVLNSVTGGSFDLCKFAGQGQRVEYANGQKLSPILPTSALIDWIDAFTTGIEYAKQNRL